MARGMASFIRAWWNQRASQGYPGYQRPLTKSRAAVRKSRIRQSKISRTRNRPVHRRKGKFTSQN